MAVLDSVARLLLDEMLPEPEPRRPAGRLVPNPNFRGPICIPYFDDARLDAVRATLRAALQRGKAAPIDPDVLAQALGEPRDWMSGELMPVGWGLELAFGPPTIRARKADGTFGYSKHDPVNLIHRCGQLRDRQKGWGKAKVTDEGPDLKAHQKAMSWARKARQRKARKARQKSEGTK